MTIILRETRKTTRARRLRSTTRLFVPPSAIVPEQVHPSASRPLTPPHAKITPDIVINVLRASDSEGMGSVEEAISLAEKVEVGSNVTPESRIALRPTDADNSMRGGPRRDEERPWTGDSEVLPATYRRW